MPTLATILVLFVNNFPVAIVTLSIVTSQQTHLLRKVIKRHTNCLARAELGCFEAANNVLKCGSYQEVFLLQSQLLALKELQRPIRYHIILF